MEDPQLLKLILPPILMLLTETRPTSSSFLSPTDDTGEVEVVVGFGGQRACRLRGRRGFRCRPGSRSGHPGFALGCGGSPGLPGLGLRFPRGG